MRPSRTQIALSLLVVIAPHLLGGVFAWGSLTLAIGAVCALGLALQATRQPRDQPGQPDSMAALLALMLAATVAHALPLPIALAELLAPETVAHVRETARGLSMSMPSSVPFSLDPGGTQERILFGIALFAAFCAARIEARSSRRTSLLAAVALSTVLIAVSDLLHRALGATQVYGLYTPDMARPRGPLLNPNNLSGFLALGFPLCLGLAVQAKAGPRWAWLLGAAVVAATNLLAGSRGGTAVLIGAGLLFGALYLLRPPRSDHGGRGRARTGSATRRWASPRLAGAALIVVTIGLALALASLAADDFIDTDYQDLTKFELYRAELDLLLQSPRTALLGVGRGAFGVAFSLVSRWFTRAREAESLPLQYAIEFGLPLALLLLGGATFHVTRALWRWRSAARLGALVGVVAIALQNLVDFSLELSGIALPAVVCLAAALPSAKPSARAWLKPLGLWRTSLVGLILCVGLIAAFGNRAVATDRIVAERALKRHFANHDATAFWALFNRVAPAHPAEPAFALLAAAQRVTENHAGASFWLRRAMQLAPAGGLPHLWAARSLGIHGQWDAALAELRIAAELDPQKTLSGLCPWVKRAPTARTVLRVAPEHGEGRIGVLDAGARCLEGFPKEAEKIDTLLLASRPEHLPARLRSAQRDLTAQRWDLVVERTQAIQRDAPTLAAPHLMEAEALIGLGKPQDAVSRLLAALSNTDDRGALLGKLARAQALADDPEGMRQTIDQLRMVGAGNAQKLAAASALLASCERQLGNDARALKAMRTAYALNPLPSFLASAAQIATKLGQTDFALSAWEQLCAQAPEDPGYCAARDALRAQRQAP